MTQKTKILTGITTTGTPHLGNYVGAIRPAIASSQQPNTESYFFLADYHALIKCQDPQQIHQSSLEIAASWLACGLNPEEVTFYRQTDVPEITELSWIITCSTAKGLMNRAHAYKAAVAENEEKKAADPDKGITMGLYSYPILMAADILIFNANKVPVGQDQIQHIEMARDIAGRFNHHYGEHFTLPEAILQYEGHPAAPTLPGLDGQKMSKSYHNTIPLFLEEKQLKKHIMKIKTNSQLPEEPKDPDTCNLYTIYSAFSTQQEQQTIRQRYQQGIGWGEMKTILYEQINQQIKQARQNYNDYINDPKKVEDILKKGGEKARKTAQPILKQIKKAIGITPLT